MQCQSKDTESPHPKIPNRAQSTTEHCIVSVNNRYVRYLNSLPVEFRRCLISELRIRLLETRNEFTNLWRGSQTSKRLPFQNGAGILSSDARWCNSARSETHDCVIVMRRGLKDLEALVLGLRGNVGGWRRKEEGWTLSEEETLEVKHACNGAVIGS